MLSELGEKRRLAIEIKRNAAFDFFCQSTFFASQRFSPISKKLFFLYIFFYKA